MYARIKVNLDNELETVKSKLEQSRLRMKELGTEQQWLDWIAKYGEDLKLKKTTPRRTGNSIWRG